MRCQQKVKHKKGKVKSKDLLWVLMRSNNYKMLLKNSDRIIITCLLNYLLMLVLKNWRQMGLLKKKHILKLITWLSKLQV